MRYPSLQVRSRSAGERIDRRTRRRGRPRDEGLAETADQIPRHRGPRLCMTEVLLFGCLPPAAEAADFGGKLRRLRELRVSLSPRVFVALNH